MSDSARRDPSELRRDTADSARRESAQRRVNRIRAFQAELEALDTAGIASLSAEQRDRIRAYHDDVLAGLAAAHDVDRSDAAGQLSRGMRIAALFAALTLTAAVYSLVSQFWGRLELPVQATLLCAFPLMSLVGVELAAARERTLYISSVFALVAFATYWLAIGVLSMLVNVPVTPPAIWGGALFGAALAMPYGFRLVLGGALVALLVALAGSVFQAAGVPWTAVPDFPEVITAAAFLLLAAGPPLGAVHPAFAAVTRGVALVVGFAGLLVLSASGTTSLLPTPTRVSALIYQAVMGVAAVTAMVVGVRRHWRETVYIAAGGFTLFVFTRFVDWFWDALPRFVFFLLLAVIAFAWLVALRRLRARVEPREAL